MEYPKDSGYYFKCEPREITDKSTEYIWPGLQLNTIESIESKYIPCCFKNNQYRKKNSNLMSYIHNVEEKEKHPHNYVLGSNKTVYTGRIGEIPYNIKILFEIAIPDRSIFKKGVEKSPDSLIHCIELATNEDYLSDPIKYVDITKFNLLSMSFSISKQETSQMSDDDIRNIILSDNYSSSDILISILEEYYKCTLLIYEVNKDNKTGMFNTHTYNYIYIHRKINTTYPVICIIKNAYEDKLQYELIFDIHSTKYTFDYKDISVLFDIYNSCNKIMYIEYILDDMKLYSYD